METNIQWNVEACTYSVSLLLSYSDVPYNGKIINLNVRSRMERKFLWNVDKLFGKSHYRYLSSRFVKMAKTT